MHIIETSGYYDDSWSEEVTHKSRRVEEITRLLGMFKVEQLPVAQQIIIVGSGVGADAEAARLLSPNASFVLVNRDLRARAAAAVETSERTTFKMFDLLQLTLEEFSSLFGNADLIIALRTSSAVASRLLTEITSSSTRFSLLFSLIVQSETEADLNIIRSRVRAQGGEIKYPHNGRDYSEIAFMMKNNLTGLQHD